jgi:hypothetical protein
MREIKILMMAATLAALPLSLSQAQTASGAPMSRDQVRTRLLDGCVYDMSRAADPLKNRTVVQCSCYAKGVSALFDEQEVAGFTRDSSVPRRIEAEAEKVFASCQK